jgi:hypothetical protein
MTVRAVILGLLGAALLCACTFFNDMVMGGTFLVGNFLPVTVFGGLVLFLLVANPLLRRLGGNAALRGGELSVIVALVLFACYVPGRGLMHQFTNVLMLPHHYAKTTPGWQGQPAAIQAEQVTDPTLLRRRLTAGLAMDTVEWQTLRRLAGTDLVDALRAAPEDGPPTAETCRRLVQGLNALIDTPAAATAIRQGRAPLPPYAQRLRTQADSLDTEAAKDLTRAFLDVALAGALTPRLPAVLRHAPPALLADPAYDQAQGADDSAGSTQALEGFVNSIAVGDEPIGFMEVPWGAWRRTLWFWLPLILTVCIGSAGLSLVIHRQWASHERLPYPTIEFAAALLPTADGRPSPVFRNRLFWLGTAAVFVLHLNNYAYAWWPETLVLVRTQLNFTPLLQLFPSYNRSGIAVWQMFYPTLYFTVIGFAYFLSSDVALSLGLAPYVFGAVTGTLAGYGIAINGPMLQPHPSNFLYAGAYCAMFLVLAYSGRRYYSSVFRRSLGLRAGDAVESSAVWGARAFLAATALFVVEMSQVGLQWPFGLLYALIMTVLLVVISRLLAEAGAFYLHSYFFPCAVLWGFLGTKAIGPDQMLIMAMLSSVLLIDPREAFMPYVVSALQIGDQARCRLGRLALCGVGALAIGLAVAVPTTLYLQYQHGAIRTGDGWTMSSVPHFAFDASSQIRQALSAQAALPALDERSPWQRFRQASPAPGSLVAFATTFVLVILFTLCRHRFAWWPIHPLLFLVLGTWQSCILAFSFFIGWLIKKSVTKYGGAGLYARLKPLMIGLIAGEMLACLVPMIIGAVYYACTGNPPKTFALFR